MTPLRPEAVIGAAPDALAFFHLTEAVPRSTAGTVALILGALGFGAEKGGFRKGAVTAVLAIEQQGFTGAFQNPEKGRTLERIFGRRIDFLSQTKQPGPGREY